jgi:hypothetical protein
MEDQKEIVQKLKVLNSMIEDFLDRMDMEGAEDEGDDKKPSKKEDK